MIKKIFQLLGLQSESAGETVDGDSAAEPDEGLDDVLKEFKSYVESEELSSDETLGSLSSEGSERIQKNLLKALRNEES